MDADEVGLLRALATLTMQAGSASGVQRWRLADRCRLAGAIAEAQMLLDAPDLPVAAFPLQRALRGAPCLDTQIGNVAQPHPVLIVDDFLPERLADQICARVKTDVGKLTSSAVHDGAYDGVDRRTRKSLIIPNVGFVASIFLPALRSFLQSEGQPIVGVSEINLDQTELQVTQHGEGAFFAAHSDAGRGQNKGRRVSFVYYFDFPERDFEGGRLRIYDGDPATGAWSSQSYTTIDPVGGRLVLFPSQAVHEVTRVSSAGASALAGRFSVNGWIH